MRLEIDDESAHHLGHAGAASGGGHYTVTIVSERSGSRDDRSFLYHGDRSEIMMDIPDDIAVRRLTVADTALPW